MPRSPPHSFFQVNLLRAPHPSLTVFFRRRQNYIAGINWLLFVSYAAARRVVSTFPKLSLPETALAGSMAGAVLTSPGRAVQMFNMWAKWGFRKRVMHGYRVIVALEIPTYAGFYRVRILQVLVWRSVPRRAAPSVGPAGERLDGRDHLPARMLCARRNKIAHPTPLHAPDGHAGAVHCARGSGNLLRSIPVVLFIPVSRAVLMWVPDSESAISFDVRYSEVFNLGLSLFDAVRTIKSLLYSTSFIGFPGIDLCPTLSV
ncbi:hypothetical protein B0H11DRAFT_2209956 [Mycena galericulata]|nr:hypothetical protein B0H11DRAFT_2209956 [Mycena galericulata]